MTCFPFFYLEKLPFLFFRTFSPQILYRHIPYSNFSEVRSLTLTLICFCVLLFVTFCWPLSCFSPGIVRLSTFVSLASYRLGLATLPPIPRRRNSTQSSSCFWDVSLDVVFYVSMLGSRQTHCIMAGARCCCRHPAEICISVFSSLYYA